MTKSTPPLPRVPLPTEFLERPIAHRALHDREAGRPENSRASIRAAAAAGYGIEIDVQLSSDGVPMVFHDDTLERLTAEAGPVGDRSAAALSAIRLTDAEDGIPSLAEVLQIVAGQVPLLIEIKQQAKPGVLARATAQVLAGYGGPVAIMSFDPREVLAFGHAAPTFPRGLTTEAYAAEDWPDLSPDQREQLREIALLDETGASFISHDATDLDRDRVAEIKARGLPVLCWTIRSPEDEARARRIADNVTFEGYPA